MKLKKKTFTSVVDVMPMLVIKESPDGRLISLKMLLNRVKLNHLLLSAGVLYV